VLVKKREDKEEKVEILMNIHAGKRTGRKK